MQFYKLHGHGNDFLIVRQEDFTAHATSPQTQAELVRAMCRPHYGAGADGLIAIAPPESVEADFRMTLWNADGGRAEMSGNGVRCAAAFCYETNAWTEDTIRMATDAGIKTIRRQSRQGNIFWLEVEIGQPLLAPEQIPVRLDRSAPLLDVPIEVDGQEIRATITSMGNPHCSIFVDRLDPQQVSRLGPQIEHHPLFPARTNVEFVLVVSRERLRVLFWERGVGVTLSSGTGSSAAAVAAMLHGLVDRSVTVESEAGELSVRWPEGGSLVLTGPACFVYRGEWA